MGFILSLPFDKNPDGTDQRTTEEYGMRWQRAIARAATDTGFTDGPAATVSGGKFRLAAGASGLLRGYYWEVVADGAGAYVETPAVAVLGSTRMQGAFLTLDRNANAITFTTRPGTASAPPAPQQGASSGRYWDLVVSRGTVAGGAAVITGPTDVRDWAVEPPGVGAVKADTARDVSTTSTGWTADGGTGFGLGATFVAPRSGTVVITVSASIKSSIDGQAAVFGWQVRAGGSVGSGAVVSPADDRWSIQNRNVYGIYASSQPYPLTGLTPGATYNIQTLLHTQGGATVTVIARALSVVPSL